MSGTWCVGRVGFLWLVLLIGYRGEGKKPLGLKLTGSVVPFSGKKASTILSDWLSCPVGLLAHSKMTYVIARSLHNHFHP